MGDRRHPAESHEALVERLRAQVRRASCARDVDPDEVALCIAQDLARLLGDAPPEGAAVLAAEGALRAMPHA